ncbi:MAG TPA: putative Ig domain-containing protein, partial [Planctomycetota bacterium]|nr:putative Ig domain-containing protein [Planctomycetota bacterium]
WDTGTQMLCLYIAQIPNSPVITSATTASGSDGVPFSYQITATSQGPDPLNPAVTIDIPLTDINAFLIGSDPAQSLLPAGLSLDNQRTIGPVANITNAALTANVATITTAAPHSFTVGMEVLIQLSPQSPTFDGEYVITSVPTPTTFTYSRTSPNVAAAAVTGTAQQTNPNFGLISGTPTEFGNFDIVLTASNVYGLGGAILHLNIQPTLANITSPLLTTGIVGLPFTVTSPSNYTFTATGSSAISYSIPPTQMPPGLTLNGNVISGTPTQRGYYNVIVTASNPAGSVQQTLTIVIYERPRISSPLAVTLTVGEVLNYQLTATGSPEQLVFTASPVPPGTQFTGTAIVGRPTQPGQTTVTMDATNITGPLYTDQSRVQLIITVLAMQITNNPLLITGTLGQAITPFQITATGSPTSFSAIDLPRGLGIDPATGIIQGTPLVAGTFEATITATNGIGTATTTLIIAISPGNGIPAITSPLTATGVVNSLVPFTYTITGSNGPTSFNAVPVQPGLTLVDLGLNLDPATGLISGRPTVSGTYEILLSATNGAGTGTATLVLGISSQPGAPAIVSPLSATAMQGINFIYQIEGSNSPTSFGASINGNSIGTIGLSVDANTGVISGAPTTAGVFSILISASNGTGQPGTATLTLTVLQPAVPAITSALTASGTVGNSFFYVIDASGFPAVYGATSLPPGLTVDPTTGVIAGTPLLAGIYSVPISAGNIYGVATATLVITIGTVPGAPVITSSTSVFGSLGQPFSYQITATNGPTSFNAINLPPGLSINTVTGLISGTPVTVATTTAIILAVNTIGTGSAQLTISIASPFPTITSATDLTGNVGVPFSYQITATGLQPITFTVSQLPPGLSLSGNMITGIPTTEGVTNAIITATNSLGPTLTPIRITIGPAVPPTILSSLNLLTMVNVPVGYTIIATGSVPMVLTATGLPPGLIQAGDSIVGAPTTPGSYAVTLTATNPGGTDIKTLLITVLTLAPNVDTDGDGFPDELEIALGTDPLSPASTPFRGAPANADPFHLAAPKLSVKMDFTALEKDSLTLTGSLPLPGGFTAPGQRMVVDIGGVIRSVTLDRRGAYTSVDKKTSMKLNARKPSPAGVNGKYSIKLRGTFRQQLSDEKIDNAPATKSPRDVILIILVSEVAYEKTTTILYSTKNNKGSGR